MKSTKKTLAISTLVMVVVLIVALSTATFAWYTQQSAADVTKTTVTSATSSTASLVIDEMKGNASSSNSSVDITMTSNIVPMMYGAGSAATVGTTTLADFKAKFVTFTVNNAGQYATTPATTAPAEITGVKGSNSTANGNSYFWVTNIGGQAANVSAKVTILPYVAVTGLTAGTSVVTGLYTLSGATYTEVTSAGTKAAADTTYYRKNDNLKVAIFVGNESASSDANYTLQGIWSVGGTYNYADYFTGTDGALVTKTAGATLISNNSGSIYANESSHAIQNNLVAGNGIQVKIAAWFEGAAMNNGLAGSASDFTVSFSAATVNPAP